MKNFIDGFTSWILRNEFLTFFGIGVFDFIVGGIIRTALSAPSDVSVFGGVFLLFFLVLINVYIAKIFLTPNKTNQ